MRTSVTSHPVTADTLDSTANEFQRSTTIKRLSVRSSLYSALAFYLVGGSVILTAYHFQAGVSSLCFAQVLGMYLKMFSVRGLNVNPWFIL